MPISLSNIRGTFLPNILFGNSWRNVTVQGNIIHSLRRELFSKFSHTGYIKVMHTEGNVNQIKNIDWGAHFEKIINPTATLESGYLGYPIIFTRYSLSFSEKVNVLSGFNEVEYLVATGANPKQATLEGYILPENALMNKWNPLPILIDAAKETGFAGYAIDTITKNALELTDPPPNPNYLISLYNQKMRAYEAIQSGNSIYIYGPQGLLIEAQCLGLQLNLIAETTTIMKFDMSLMVTDVTSSEVSMEFVGNLEPQ